jgi:excisionase family DNA binding protein
MIAMLEKNWISVSEAAKVIGCTPQHLRAMVARGQIVHERVGHAWLLDKKSVEKIAKNPAKTGRPRNGHKKDS